MLGGHLRQPDVEVLFQLRFEREIRLDLVPGPGELEVLADAGPGELNGDQDQRRATLGGAGVGLVPLEDPEGEVRRRRRGDGAWGGRAGSRRGACLAGIGVGPRCGDWGGRARAGVVGFGWYRSVRRHRSPVTGPTHCSASQAISPAPSTSPPSNWLRCPKHCLDTCRGTSIFSLNSRRSTRSLDRRDRAVEEARVQIAEG